MISSFQDEVLPEKSKFQSPCSQAKTRKCASSPLPSPPAAGGEGEDGPVLGCVWCNGTEPNAQRRLIQISLLNPITVAPSQGNNYLWQSRLARTLAIPKARLSKRLLCSSDVLEYAWNHADCKSAIQQITNLRYVTAVALRGSQAGWGAWEQFVTCRGSHHLPNLPLKCHAGRLARSWGHARLLSGPGFSLHDSTLP